MDAKDIDIISLDTTIRESFLQEQSMLPIYKERLGDLECTYQKLKDVKRKTLTDIERSMDELKSHIQHIETNEDFNFYIAETAQCLQEYRELLSKPVKLSFMGKTTIDFSKKRDIVTRYMNIAQKYYQITLPDESKGSKRIYTCENCGNKSNFDMSENSKICMDCGLQYEQVEYTASYKDIHRVNVTAKYTYDRKVHFRDCINQYQGKQNCTIEQKVYDMLEDALERHHLLLGDKTTKREIRFSKITKEHILMFLKELGFSKHYENVVLIHYTLTGIKPDDIGHLEDKLMTDFDLLIETYDKKFKNKVDRVNFISTQYVLYQLLLRHKHPCKKEDFVILKTVERKSFHDNICKEIFSSLNWNHVPLF